MSDTRLGDCNMEVQIQKDPPNHSEFMQSFQSWGESDQNDFVESLLSKMTHYQHSQINLFLKPMLQRDFISLLPS